MTSRTETRSDSAVPDKAAQHARCLLRVVEVNPGLHEKAEGIRNWPVFRLSWQKEPARLLGRWHIPGTNKGSGKFVKVPPDRVIMPEEAVRRYHEASNSMHTDATAVFLSTQLGNSRVELILASRTNGQWSELYRWVDSWREIGLSRLDICSF